MGKAVRVNERYFHPLRLTSPPRSPHCVFADHINLLLSQFFFVNLLCSNIYLSGDEAFGEHINMRNAMKQNESVGATTIPTDTECQAAVRMCSTVVGHGELIRPANRYRVNDWQFWMAIWLNIEQDYSEFSCHQRPRCSAHQDQDDGGAREKGLRRRSFPSSSRLWSPLRSRVI